MTPQIFGFNAAIAVKGFTEKYNITRLVYYEVTNDIRSAIDREKQIKGWLRAKKIALIESMNPEWKDLSADWFDDGDFDLPEPARHSGCSFPLSS